MEWHHFRHIGRAIILIWILKNSQFRDIERRHVAQWRILGMSKILGPIKGREFDQRANIRFSSILLHHLVAIYQSYDRLCGLVVRVSGYRSGGPGFDSRALQGKRKVVDLDRSPLSLVSTTEGLLGRNSSGSGLESRKYGG
jgi:hypothetical protein